MDIFELSIRFVLLLLSILILYYFGNRQKTDVINPLLMIVGMCTFSLCYLFTKVEVGVGIGFGLFAIFSILRFRTQSFNISSIIFLFAIITISILDIMSPTEKYWIVLFFQSALILMYVLISVKVVHYTNNFDLVLAYKDAASSSEEMIRKNIAEKLKVDKFSFKIDSVNTISEEIHIKVFY